MHPSGTFSRILLAFSVLSAAKYYIIFFRIEEAFHGPSDTLVDQAGHIVDTEQNQQLAKIRAEHRRWLAYKLNRRVYGDKIDIGIKQTLDVAPALQGALERMKTITVPAPALIEAEGLGTT